MTNEEAAREYADAATIFNDLAARHGPMADEYRRRGERDRLAAKALRAHEGLVKALEELADLMEAVRTGEYAPDSFTCQPARAALSEARKP